MSRKPAHLNPFLSSDGMKTILYLSILLIIIRASPLAETRVVYAQDATATPVASEPTLQLTDTPIPINIATATPQPSPTDTSKPLAGRPQLVVTGYYASMEPIHAGCDFDLEISIRNDGSWPAQGVSLVFNGDNFYVRETGGVWSIPALPSGESYTIRQPLTASWSLAGYTVGTTTATASYSDGNGTAYSDTFSFSVDIYFDSNWGKPTPTPILGENPQLIVQGYHVNVAELRPGVTFALELEIANPGSRLAKGVNMVFGEQAGSGSTSTTAAAGSKVPFAALDTSNLVHVGDLYPGETRGIAQRLIVDLQVTAGVYTLPLAFEYFDEKGAQHTDNQVVTLIAHTTPQLKISFYENPGELRVGESAVMPIQVTNMGYQTVLLGDLRLSARQDGLTSDTAFIGPLESGGSFTHDAEITPSAAGVLEIQVAVDYNDIYGRPQNIIQTLTVSVASDGNSPSNEGTGTPIIVMEEAGPPEENFLQNLVRFFRSLLGLGG